MRLNLLRGLLFLCFNFCANFDRDCYLMKKRSTNRSLKNLYFERLFGHKRCNAYREIVFYVNSLEKKFFRYFNIVLNLTLCSINEHAR